MTILAYIAIAAWLLACLAYTRSRRAGDVLVILGILCGAALIGSLWITLARPPMRTLGETRWWYVVLVPSVGAFVGWRFRTRVILVPSCLMGCLFAIINLTHPEAMDKTLMPALQSIWFVPHVVVYMLAYSALGLSSLLGAWTIVARTLRKQPFDAADADLPHRLVMIGFPLLTCGLLFGAFWAKEAWGHYWTWDPKETWAFLTWAAYLLYLHVRAGHTIRPRLNLALLVFGFAVLMMCWFGVQYLPTARESVHTYSG